MAKISERHIKAWEKFNNELVAFTKTFGDEFAYLYEDAYTMRIVKDFKMTKSGILTWQEQEYASTKVTKEREQMWDEEDAKEWLKFWRACFRRAKRYNEMPLEVLEAIQEGEIEDTEEN
jgi:hypothetical protein